MNAINSLICNELKKELDSGYDVVKFSNLSFKLYQEHVLALTPEMGDLLLSFVAMQEGFEFEYKEEEVLEAVCGFL